MVLGNSDHDPTITECPVCHGPVREEHTHHLNMTYYWCSTCSSAIYCACETCETFRALAGMGI